MSKEQKILDQFCKKAAEKGISIFAQDAAPAEKPEWITMNGTHIHVGEGETPKEAGEKFAEKKETERQKKPKQSLPMRGARYEADYFPTGVKVRRKPSDFDGDTFDNAKNLSLKIRGHGFKLNKMDDNKAFIEDKKGGKHIITFKTNKDGSVTVTKTEPLSTTENLQKSTSVSALPKKTTLKDIEVKLSQKRTPLSKKEQAVHNSMMDLIHEQHQYETNRRDYLDAKKTMKQLENTYRGKFTPEYQKAKQKADAALTKYSFALQKFRDLQSKMKTEHGIELTDKL